MSIALQNQLQAALGGSLLIEEELSGGGMSRVFRARDNVLNRDIVVKVLPPELVSGVNLDRFQREIQLAAQLQHPHIVPILAAGEIDGLPYLTMPFVAGRSLRQRLEGQAQLPIAEVVSVLRDVARALDYAHSRGVIHRDIKPDNVLLSRGAATVTDFGVAKAVTEARLATGALTGIGTSIGTPTYMAPEQAAGDPDTDHRADIYAWGVMAYELLAGRPPFSHRMAHRLLAAHISETPAAVTDHRPDCPPLLAALVMRCLTKDRDGRPQSAADLLQALTEAGTASGGGHDALSAISIASRRTLVTALGVYAAAFVIVAALSQGAVMLIGLPEWVLPGTLIVMALGLPVVVFTAVVHHGSRVARTMAMRAPDGSLVETSWLDRLAVKARRHLTWRRTALGGVFAVGAFAMLVAGFMLLRALGIGPVGSLFARGVISESDRVIVTDFLASDSTLGPVISEGVRTGLAQSKSIAVVTATQVAGSLRRMERPASSRVDLALARQIAEREGIKAILDGEVTPVRDSYIITLKLHAVADSSQVATYQETAKDPTDLVPAIDRATRRLREKIGDSFKSVRAAPRLENVTTASLPALRKYTEGWRANIIEQDLPKAINALEEAVTLDTTFAIAYRQAALVYRNARLRPGRADTLRGLAFRHRERLPVLERSLVEGAYYMDGLASDRPNAIAAYERAVATDSTNASALNQLGLLEYSRRRYARAESLFLRMRASNPENVYGWALLVPMQVAGGKVEQARHALRDGLRRFPGNALLVEWSQLTWPGDEGRDSLTALCESMSQSSSSTQRARGLWCQAGLSYTAGRIRDASSKHRLQLALDRFGRPHSAMTPVLDSLLDAVWFYERRSGVARRLDEVVAREPVRSQAVELRSWNSVPQQHPYFRIAELYAMAGQPEKARRTLAQYAADVRDTAQVRLERSAHDHALGEIAIAEANYDEAIRAFQRADTAPDGWPVECNACSLPRLARAYDLAEKPDLAIATFEAYLAATHPWRLGDIDYMYLAGAYKRLGELYEAKGNREKAIEYHRRFIRLWKDADPELRPKVVMARQRLARLELTERARQ